MRTLQCGALIGAFLIGWGGCAKPLPQDPVPDHKTLKIDSEVLQELRIVNIYTPVGYAESDVNYPVLYMPDGGINEDFPHIVNTIDRLIREEVIAPVLVVGIENTDRRRDLNGPTKVERDLALAPRAGGSNNFRKFIRTELMPEIQKRYRVSDQTAIVGESAAGVFVVETFFLEPDLFDRYMAMDPALYWNDRELVRRAEERLPGLQGKSLRLWLTTGTTPEITPAVTELSEILKTHAPADLDWTFDPRPQEQHSTIFRATKEAAFKWGLWKSQKPQ